MKIVKPLVLFSILVLALFLRLYKIDNPVADWHSFRQADTASVTRNFSEKGLNIFVPTYHDVSNIQSGFDNPGGYRMVEMPLYNGLHLAVYKAYPAWGIDKSGRLTSVIISLVSIIFVYLIGKKLSGYKTGLIAALFMAVLPFNIFYSRVILPEPLMIATFLGSFWFLLQTVDNLGTKKRIYFFLSALLLAVSILVKPYALFFTLPHLAIIFRTLVKKEINFIDIVVYAFISLIPFYLWRQHIQLYPEGIPVSVGLLNYYGIRLRPAWFRWLFSERIGKLILGVYGTIFLILGLISKPKKEGLTYWLWAIGVLIYFVVVADGSVRHDYYQATIVPFLCLVLAKGVLLFANLPKATYSRFLTLFATVTIFVGMLLVSWYDIKGYYQINNPVIIEAGQAIDRLTPKDAKVIAPYNGDTAFLYQTHRSGWPLGYDIQKHIDQGATYYASVNFDDEMHDLEKKYQVIEKTDKYVIIKLEPKTK
jgi:hypothetical protein